MRRIGILGGTFDPPHIGHLIIAEEVLEVLELDEIWFVPSCEPPHKHQAFVSSQDRAEMVERAIAGNPHFSMNMIEINRLGSSFTFDTMKLLQHDNPDAEFYFVIGADMVEYLPHWKYIDELVELVTFVGVNRQGYGLQSDYPVLEIEVPLIGLSSTDIRRRAANQQSVKYMVPASVETYIKEKHLYEQKRSN